MRGYNRQWQKPMCPCGRRMVFKASESHCWECRSLKGGNGRPPQLRLYLEPSGYYKLLYGSRRVYLHRFLYALSTGRDIRGRPVHHENGRLDNRPEALVDLSVTEHQQVHFMTGDRPMTSTERSALQRQLHPERSAEYQRRFRDKRAAVA